MSGSFDNSAYKQALERYISIFRNGESSIDGVRSSLNSIRNDSMLPVYRQGIDAILAQLTVAELALEALVFSTEALWRVQQVKEAAGQE